MSNGYDYKPLPPFKWYVLQNFPFIDADFDAITNYQLFCKVVEYLNKVIESQNEVGEQVELLTNSFNDLKQYVDNYFDNLDIQEELNKKLDEMADDGTLQQMMNSYLTNSVITFATVEDMIESTFLIDGSNCRTMGYYEIGDNGGALYHIVETDPEIDGQIELDSGLYAYLVIENDTVNVKQFGAKGTGTDDDTDVIQLALDYGAKNVIFDKGIYLITSCLYPKSNVYGIDKVNTMIYFPDQNPDITPILTNSIFYILDINNIEIKDICLKGGYITGSSGGANAHCIAMRHCENVEIHDCLFENPQGDGIYIGGGRVGEEHEGQSKLINIYNNTFTNVKRCAVSFIHCDIVNVHDNSIYKPHTHVGVFDLEPNDSRQQTTNIKIVSNYCETTGAFVKCYYSQTNLNNPKYLLIKDNVVTCSIFYYGNNDSNTDPYFDELYVLNNVVTDSQDSYFCGLKKAVIKGNTMTKSLRFTTDTNVDIISNNLRDIILVSSCDTFIIAENILTRNTYSVAGACIVLTAGNNIVIKNNYLCKVRNGIRFQLAENIGNVFIKNNTIITSKWGIYMYSSSYTYGNIKVDNNEIIHDVQEDTNTDVTFVPYYDQLTRQLERNNYFDYNAIGTSKLNKVAITGEYLQNTNPSLLGEAPNQYIIKGWLCIDGENNTWYEDRITDLHTS